MSFIVVKYSSQHCLQADLTPWSYTTLLYAGQMSAVTRRGTEIIYSANGFNLLFQYRRVFMTRYALSPRHLGERVQIVSAKSHKFNVHHAATSSTNQRGLEETKGFLCYIRPRRAALRVLEPGGTEY